MEFNLPFLQKCLALQEAKISSVETVIKRLTFSYLIFCIFEMNVSVLLLAISKWLELIEPDCIQFENNLTKIIIF